MPQADVLEFDLTAGPHPAGDLLVLSFEADEAVSRPFSVEVVAAIQPGVAVDFAGLIGGPAALTLQVPGGDPRVFNGIVVDARNWQEGTAEPTGRCRLRIVPAVWTLGLNRRSRIFQAMSVPAIVKKVLGDANVKQKWSVSGTYQPLEYCVQYAESDLDFISRLLEEVGIFYFFTHASDGHTMVFGDAPSNWQPIAGDDQIPFREERGFLAGVEFINRFLPGAELRPSAVTLRDYNFLSPALDLTSKATASGSGPTLEVYEYPGRYADHGLGDQLARIRLDQARLDIAQTEGGGASRRLQPGSVFELTDHPLASLNSKYQLIAVHHRGSQAAVVLASSAPEERYQNQFFCIPKAQSYRPPQRTPKPVIAGPQTAVVSGASGEEIYTDANGRIKVQFHWDRDGKQNEQSSCWIRVSQSWAGPGWGALFLPRIGQEVVVEFLEGDPDRPLVTGAVYNGTNTPPVSLPGDKTKSTLKTSSTPGGAGSNELRFDDAAGSEEVYLHAQKDLNIVIENNKGQSIGNDESLTVGANQTTQIGGNETLTVGGDESISIQGNKTLTVGADQTITIGANRTETVSGAHTTSVGSVYSLTVAGLSTEVIAAAKDLNIGSDYAVTVGGALAETIGGVKSEDVSGDKSETIGGSRSETIGGGRTLSVGGDFSEEIGGGRTLKIGKDMTLNVGGKLDQVVADKYVLKVKDLTLDASDSFLLKVGSATIEVKQSGEVDIKGSQVQVQASGNVVLKGSTITQN